MYWHVETDIFALAIFIIMFVKTTVSKVPKTHQEVGFDIVLKLSLVATTVSLIAALVRDFCTNWWIYQLVVSFSYAILPVMAMTWACYAVGLICHDDRKWAWRAITAMAIPLQFCIVFCMLNPIHNLLFTLTPDLEFIPGPWLMPVSLCTLHAYSLAGVFLTLFYRKRIQPPSHVLVLLFVFLITSVSLYFEFLFPGALLVCPTYAICFILCDATIQEQRRRDLMLELSRAMKEAQSANDAKTQFFARMSHDMRTPLNGILGLSRIVQEKESDPKIVSDMEQLTLSGKYLLHLVNDTLDISKIEAGQMELHPEPSDPKSLASNVGVNAQTLASEKGVNLAFEMPDLNTIDHGIIVIDGSRLEQVLMNIVSNAIKFTPTGGHVTLSFDITPSGRGNRFVHYHFSVTDDGPGMAADFIPHLFEPYSQETRLGAQNQGTGLGMSIVKQLVDLMDGTIKVKSEVGKGTSIILDFDFEHFEGDVPTPAKPIDFSALKGKHILLVEDHPINARIAIELLKEKGAEVEWRDDGKKGIEAFFESEPGFFDCILMDIRMPVMDGMEATKAIRADSRPDASTVPIVALTANAFEDDIKATRAVGMNDHVAKPFEPDRLFRAIAALCS